MKSLLTGISTILLYAIILIVSFDSKMYLQQTDELKFITQELSATGALFLDYENYAEGDIIFKDKEGIKAINDQMKAFMKLDDENKPKENSYWQDIPQYTVYFYDDSGKCRVYKNGVFDRQFNFSYPHLHRDDDYDFKQTISSATVIVNINAGRPRLRFKPLREELQDIKTIRTSSHTWDGYQY